MAVIGLQVKTPPTKTEYVATELLDLTGMVVTIIDDDVADTDVALEDFGANLITTSPADGDALSFGDTTITVTYNDGESDMAVTTQLIMVYSIGINLGNIPPALRAGGGYVRWQEGQKLTVTPTVRVPNETNQSVTWSSTDESILVAEDNVIQAMGLGTATLTAAAVSDPGVTAEVTIEVITISDHLTGAQFHKLLLSMDMNTQMRFYEESLRRMIEIPNSDDNLHTAQLALICSVI